MDKVELLLACCMGWGRDSRQMVMGDRMESRTGSHMGHCRMGKGSRRIPGE